MNIRCTETPKMKSHLVMFLRIHIQLFVLTLDHSSILLLGGIYTCSACGNPFTMSTRGECEVLHRRNCCCHSETLYGSWQLLLVHAAIPDAKCTQSQNFQVLCSLERVLLENTIYDIFVLTSYIYSREEKVSRNMVDLNNKTIEDS